MDVSLYAIKRYNFVARKGGNGRGVDTHLLWEGREHKLGMPANVPQLF